MNRKKAQKIARQNAPVLEEVKGMHQRLKYLEDTDLVLRAVVARMGGTITLLDADLTNIPQMRAERINGRMVLKSVYPKTLTDEEAAAKVAARRQERAALLAIPRVVRVSLGRGEDEDVRLFMDGDQVCATLPDFVDVQTSPCGFGATEESAIEALRWALRDEAQRKADAAAPDSTLQGGGACDCEAIDAIRAGKATCSGCGDDEMAPVSQCHRAGDGDCELLATAAQCQDCPDPEAATESQRLELVKQAEEVLDPSYPIEKVNEELRAAGYDPEEVGRRGEELARALLAQRRLGLADSSPHDQVSLTPADEAALESARAQAETPVEA